MNFRSELKINTSSTHHMPFTHRGIHSSRVPHASRTNFTEEWAGGTDAPFSSQVDAERAMPPRARVRLGGVPATLHRAVSPPGETGHPPTDPPRPPYDHFCSRYYSPCTCRPPITRCPHMSSTHHMTRSHHMSPAQQISSILYTSPALPLLTIR